MSSVPPNDSPDDAERRDEPSSEPGVAGAAERSDHERVGDGATAGEQDAALLGAEAPEASATEPAGGQRHSPSLDEIDVRDLLRDALRVTPARGVPAVRGAVQRAIRERSGGRFFSDAWSTSAAPRATFLVTSLLLVALVIAAWFLLSPTGFELLGR